MDAAAPVSRKTQSFHLGGRQVARKSGQIPLTKAYFAHHRANRHGHQAAEGVTDFARAPLGKIAKKDFHLLEFFRPFQPVQVEVNERAPANLVRLQQRVSRAADRAGNTQVQETVRQVAAGIRQQRHGDRSGERQPQAERPQPRGTGAEATCVRRHLQRQARFSYSACP